MQVEVMCRPANAAAKVTLAAGETITAEAGAMIAMSGDTTVETTTLKKQTGGIVKALKRMLAGESFFLNHFTASAKGGEVWLAPTLPGDVMQTRVGAAEEGPTLLVQSGSFLACTEGVDVDLGWQGIKSLFAGESLFWLRLKGEGLVILSSFGAIYPVDVDGEYVVDSGHIVAFPETLRFQMTKAGGSWLTAILGGEGLVCHFKGKGRIWCQSHNPAGFGKALGRMLKPREA